MECIQTASPAILNKSLMQETHRRKRQRSIFDSQKKFLNPFYAINIFNTIYYFKPQTLIVRRENTFCKFHTFFGFVYHVSCLPWFKTKNKIRCNDAPKYAFTRRNLPKSEKYIWIIQNIHEKSRFTETVEFLECSLASMLMRYCCSMIGCCWVFFASFF